MPRKYGLSGSEAAGLGQVAIPAVLRDQILDAARLTRLECCAALYGHVRESVLSFAGWRPLTNLANSGDHFVVATGELLGACPGPDRPGQPGAAPRLLGLLHSHPRGPADPSDADRIGIARLPFVWVILGAGPGGAEELRAFTWSADGVRELPTSAPRSPGSQVGPVLPCPAG